MHGADRRIGSHAGHAGIDRFRRAGRSAADPARCQVYGVALGDAAKARLVALAGELRGAGISVDLAYGGRGMKGAMKGADRSGARYTLVLGDRDLAEHSIGVKDMATGEQRAVPVGELFETVRASVER